MNWWILGISLWILGMAFVLAFFQGAFGGDGIVIYKSNRRKKNGKSS